MAHSEKKKFSTQEIKLSENQRKEQTTEVDPQ